MQPQHGTDIILPLLILTDNLFIIGITQESECDTVSTEGRLNDIGDIFLIGILIEKIKEKNELIKNMRKKE